MKKYSLEKLTGPSIWTQLLGIRLRSYILIYLVLIRSVFKILFNSNLTFVV